MVKAKPVAVKPYPKSKYPYCIVRCRNAGVHAGEVVSRKNGTLTMRNSRRLWRWWSAATLSELSQAGPIRLSENRYGCVLPTLILTESDVCEVIECTNAARLAIAGVQVWVNK